MLLLFCLEKDLCVEYMVYDREEEEGTFRMGENETEIDLVLIRKNADSLCDM